MFKKLALTAALLALGATSAFAGNLLVNGDFETGNLNGWTAWHATNYGNGGFADINPRINGDLFVPGGPHSGSFYASAQIGYATGMGGAYQTLNVANGEYTVSGWLAGGTQGSDGDWQLLAWDGDFPGGDGSGGTEIVGYTPVWTQGTKTINVTSGKLTVAFRVGQWWAGLTGGHVDDISVTSNTVPEPSSILALLSGVAGLAGFAFRKRS